MSQHFLLSSKARTPSLAQVMRLTDEEAWKLLVSLRWADNGGEPSGTGWRWTACAFRWRAAAMCR